jgi:hypothetical protein
VLPLPPSPAVAELHPSSTPGHPRTPGVTADAMFGWWAPPARTFYLIRGIARRK